MVYKFQLYEFFVLGRVWCASVSKDHNYWVFVENITPCLYQIPELKEDANANQ